MIDQMCRVKVGTHLPPYWRDKTFKGPPFIVCTRHMQQYEERSDELGPFDWEKVT